MMGQESAKTARVHCPTEESEAQYNLRVAFPSYPQTRETWIAASRELERKAKPTLDLAYGDEPLQKLDYYAAQPNGPLLVFVHGGYWQGGDKADVGFVSRPYVQAGIDVAVINYSLAPAATIEAMVAEVRQSLTWLADNAAGLGFDPRRISLMGHSAGGHLVSMMVAGTPDNAAGMPAIDYVFPISGVFDLAPLRASSVNDALGLDEARAEALSPVAWPGPAQARVHTFVGANETQQFHFQSEALGQAWSVAKHDSVPGTHHFTVLDVMGDPASAYARAVIDAILE